MNEGRHGDGTIRGDGALVVPLLGDSSVSRAHPRWRRQCAAAYLHMCIVWMSELAIFVSAVPPWGGEPWGLVCDGMAQGEAGRVQRNIILTVPLPSLILPSPFVCA